MLNIIKTTKTVTDRQMKADAKDRLMSAMIQHAATEIATGDATQAIASHVLTVAIKAMNVGADAVALEDSVAQALEAAVAALNGTDAQEAAA